jgi:hypothetical protein
MNQTSSPEFDQLDFWYAQLYNWISASPSSRDDVVGTIIDECKANFHIIANSIDGKFVNDEIEDRTLYIRFNNLLFKQDLNGRSINCNARIRINPCIKLPIFCMPSGCEEQLNNGIIPRELVDAFSKHNIHLPSNLKISKALENNNCIWAIEDEEEYILRKVDGRIEVYSKAIAPFYSKIWVIISVASKFNEEEKELFFQKTANIAKTLCDQVATVYLHSIPGGAESVSESCSQQQLHRIKIKSIATNDDRVLALMVDRTKQKDLSQKLKGTGPQDISEYLNNILDGILTNLCGIRISGWKSYLKSDNIGNCIKGANWKVIESGDVTGLYATTQRENSTITSAAFHFRNNNSDSVNDVLRAWGKDLNAML